MCQAQAVQEGPDADRPGRQGRQARRQGCDRAADARRASGRSLTGGDPFCRGWRNTYPGTAAAGTDGAWRDDRVPSRPAMMPGRSG